MAHLITTSNPPAFPTERPGDNSKGGMSLRDYFAAKAMQGIYASPDLGDWTDDMVAQAAYRQADAMLRARQSVPTS